MKNINEKYKALAFFDLDGTLLNAQSQLDQEVIDALAQIKANGVLPFIATGRGHFELGQIMAESGITGAVAMNGQYIILDGEIIYKEAIEQADIEKLIAASEKVDESLSFYDDNGYWVNRITDFTRTAYAYTHAPLPAAQPDRYKTNEVNMMLVLTNQLSQVDYYKAQVQELNFFMNSPSSIDVTNISTNKGTGIKQLIKHLGFTGETYAFGDGRNDLHLLQSVDHKTAMGNSIPELIEIADFVTTKNTEHGIINAFQHWGLI